MKREILVGREYGLLEVIEFAGFYGRHTHWKCICKCGGEAVVTTCNLKRGNTTSCGCLQREKSSKSSRTHGLSSHGVYNAWRAMINRCEDPNNIMFHRYGLRGITVCFEWHKFENFISDMGIPKEGKAIDRIDNNKGYYKENCRWVDRKTNNRNTSKTIMAEWDGVKTPLIELGEKYDINYKCLYKRIKSGWSIEEALFTKSGERRAKVG